MGESKDQDEAKARVFLCYRAQSGSHAARAIRTALTEGGIEVFQDVDEVHLGDSWKQKVKDRIERCDVVVVVVDKQWDRVFDTRDSIRYELKLASDAEVPVVPVLIDSAAPPTPPKHLPPVLAGLAETSMEDWDPGRGYEESKRRLLYAVTHPSAGRSLERSPTEPERLPIALALVVALAYLLVALLEKPPSGWKFEDANGGQTYSWVPWQPDALMAGWLLSGAAAALALAALIMRAGRGLLVWSAAVCLVLAATSAALEWDDLNVAWNGLNGADDGSVRPGSGLAWMLALAAIGATAAGWAVMPRPWWIRPVICVINVACLVGVMIAVSGMDLSRSELSPWPRGALLVRSNTRQLLQDAKSAIEMEVRAWGDDGKADTEFEYLRCGPGNEASQRYTCTADGARRLFQLPPGSRLEIRTGATKLRLVTNIRDRMHLQSAVDCEIPAGRAREVFSNRNRSSPIVVAIQPTSGPVGRFRALHANGTPAAAHDLGYNGTMSLVQVPARGHLIIEATSSALRCVIRDTDLQGASSWVVWPKAGENIDVVRNYSGSTRSVTLQADVGKKGVRHLVYGAGGKAHERATRLDPTANNGVDVPTGEIILLIGEGESDPIRFRIVSVE